jgi:hypothetical protein
MSQERNYMEFVFSPQGLAVDVSNGILKSDDAGFLYCGKIETFDISNNSITSDKLESNISLYGLNVNVITGSSIYSENITCNNLYVMNGQQGETGPIIPTSLQGVAAYASSVTLTTSSPQNILITTDGDTTLTLPNTPPNGTYFDITKYTNYNVVITASGTDKIQNLPRPTTSASNTTIPELEGSIIMYVTSADGTGWFLGIWGITIIYFNGTWYVTKQVIN